MDETSNVKLNYPTHSLLLTECVNGFIKAANIVEGEVYSAMVDVVIYKQLHNRASYIPFVEEERKLLSNFIKSLTGFYNNDKNKIYAPHMYSFSDELEYYIFCMTNDIPFSEQEWFKVIYIKTSLLNAISAFKDASTKLIRILYPKYYTTSPNILEKAIKKLEYENKNYKCPYSKIENFLKENKIEMLYHFTSKDNIDSIKQHGLCSIDRLSRLGIEVQYASSEVSRNLDYRKQLSNYVHLSYEQKHPMLYQALVEGRLSEYTVYNISPEVLILKTTLFTNGNAARNNVHISDSIDFLLNINFKSFHNKNYWELSQEEQLLFQSEVLVQEQIEKQFIVNI